MKRFSQLLVFLVVMLGSSAIYADDHSPRYRRHHHRRRQPVQWCFTFNMEGITGMDCHSTQEACNDVRNFESENAHGDVQYSQCFSRPLNTQPNQQSGIPE
jgi:hypothetical protein